MMQKRCNCCNCNWMWKCSKLPQAWRCHSVPFGPELCTPALLLPPLLRLVVCAALWLIHQQMRQLPTGVACSTHTHTHSGLKCNKSVRSSRCWPFNAASLSLPSPLSYLALSFGRHFIWYFLLHFQVLFSQHQQQQLCSSFYIYTFSFGSLYSFCFLLPGLKVAATDGRRAFLSISAVPISLSLCSPRFLLMCKLFMTHSWFIFLSFSFSQSLSLSHLMLHCVHFDF